jgi:hypothetical protein
MPRYLGLLVGPGEGPCSWSTERLQLTAWIVQDERGRVVCEQAALERKP